MAGVVHTRRASDGWKKIAAAGCILASLGLFGEVWLFGRVQDSRKQVIHDACVEQNHRFERTVAQLDALIEALPDGARKERARQNKASTVALISALAPKRDCEQLIRDRFG